MEGREKLQNSELVGVRRGDSRTIWWWVDNDKGALILDLAVLVELGLEKAFLLPPLVPSSLDGDRVIGCIVGVAERADALLLARRGIVLVRWKGRLLYLCLLLLGLGLVRCASGGGGLGGGSFLLVELCLLFGLFSLLLQLYGRFHLGWSPRSGTDVLAGGMSAGGSSRRRVLDGGLGLGAYRRRRAIGRALPRGNGISAAAISGHGGSS